MSLRLREKVRARSTVKVDLRFEETDPGQRDTGTGILIAQPDIFPDTADSTSSGRSLENLEDENVLRTEKTYF